ncbi:hypothetical protein APX70_200576 [Pseudomonas syringae pv. maculicola]|uniref:Uncharacterized protein n=1 Tax=Pseudomonas syringae pv. maculicola TaxID=59511 RepID=A0A3M2W5V1_PSEYM|nr:hypothetical protein APX70_200576 [Pseudomonas syringae pv. maculicola]
MLPCPVLPLFQPPLICTLSPAINAWTLRSCSSIGNSAPATSPSSRVTLPLTSGASKLPDSRPLPFKRPLSFCTIGANGRATEMSRPDRLKSPAIVLFLASGSICAFNSRRPSLPPSKSRRESMRLGVRVLASFKVW